MEIKDACRLAFLLFVRICVCFYSRHPVGWKTWTRTRIYLHMPLSLAVCNLLTTHPLCALPLRCCNTFLPCLSLYRVTLSSSPFLFLPNLSQLKKTIHFKRATGILSVISRTSSIVIFQNNNFSFIIYDTTVRQTLNTSLK